MKFSYRSETAEIMDDLNFGGVEMDQALRELEIINKWLGGNTVTISGLNRLIKRSAEVKSLAIVDLGCGGGDMLMLVAQWGRKKGIHLKLTGIDANPYIIDYARKNSQSFPDIKYQVADVFDQHFQQQQYDIVINTLFTHHFTESQLSLLLPVWQKQARLGMVINDLHRHWLAYYSIVLITKIWSRSDMVKNDGPISVLRAFSRKDWENLLKREPFNDYILRWRWAFRWLLVIPSPRNH